jgi:hypothetical protein
MQMLSILTLMIERFTLSRKWELGTAASFPAALRDGEDLVDCEHSVGVSREL